MTTRRALPPGVCVHNWMLDSSSLGTCAKCGEVRSFAYGPLLGKAPSTRHPYRAVWSKRQREAKTTEGPGDEPDPSQTTRE